MVHGVVQIGAVLAGRYRVDRVLGQGGMGLVVAATHLQLQQQVAIKVLLPEVLANQEIVQRFLREAQAAVRLRSEHVARVIDVGTFENGAPYMVLEYLEGSDLANLPRSQLSVGVIIDLILQACEALAEAHSLGIVHRDIKPANFFVTRRADGSPMLKVLDFGISKVPVANRQLTATQAVMGTPAYMSPEQMRSSRDVDHRSDIWALGVVLYELLQGAPPYEADTFSSMVVKVITEPLPPLTIPLPAELGTAVYRCLEKDPARRFQNIAELALALARYAHSTAQASISVQRTRGIVGMAPPQVAVEPGTSRRSSSSTLSNAVGAMTMQRTPRRRWPVAAVALGLLGGVVGVAIIATSGGGPDSGKLEVLPTSVAPALRGASQAPGTPPAVIATPSAAPSPTSGADNAPPLSAPNAAALPSTAREAVPVIPSSSPAVSPADESLDDADSAAPVRVPITERRAPRKPRKEPPTPNKEPSKKEPVASPSDADLFDLRN